MYLKDIVWDKSDEKIYLNISYYKVTLTRIVDLF